MKKLQPNKIKSLDGLTLTEQKVLALHFNPSN